MPFALASVVTLIPTPHAAATYAIFYFPNEYKYEKLKHVRPTDRPGVNVTYDNSADEPEVVVQ